MEPANAVKTRRPRRSKADIEEAINKAAISQIKKRGFSLALVTDIVKRAKIEPIVFYNRYKNLDEFYDEFVKNYDYWMSDLIRDSIREVGTEEGFCNILEKLMHNLMADDIMVELLRWEVAEKNRTTERTARLRELHAIELTNSYSSLNTRPDLDVTAITSIIVGGIYYLILHKDRSSIVGIDINTPDGKRRIINALREISSLMFHDKENEQLTDGSNMSQEAESFRKAYETACRERVESDFRGHVEEVMEARRVADRERIAARLRSEGVAEDVIARCIK